MATQNKVVGVKKVLVMAGGTGGHVFPALAAARAFQHQGIEVKWLGTRAGIESRIVPEQGLDIEYLDVAGVRGQGLKRLLLAPFKIAKSILTVFQLIKTYQPDMVLGMGGFVTGPGGIGAWLSRTPLFIHEQNAIAGFTNRILARFSVRVFQAFPNTFNENTNVTTTGNPVRQEITSLEEPAKRFEARQGKLRLLILGGSQGAVALNETVPEALADASVAGLYQIRHQAGGRTFEKTQQRYQQLGVEADVFSFIDDMAEAYAWADFVVCRSGALTVCELAAAGVGALLVPYPFAVDDHQTKNGQYLESRGAAWVVQQQALTPMRLAEILSTQFNNRESLLQMAESARSAAKTDATDSVVNGCLETLNA